MPRNRVFRLKMTDISTYEDATVHGYAPVKFQADSALLRELGERLVGQPHIALAELIKNAYDADATLCTISIDEDQITVSDNGHGMTKTEFLTYWMTLGTRNKQDQDTSRYLRRSVTGSKGVGRLSAQFLAHRLEMVTAPKSDPTVQLRALVDWDDAIDAGKLTEAEAFFKTESRDNVLSGRQTARNPRHDDRSEAGMGFRGHPPPRPPFVDDPVTVRCLWNIGYRRNRSWRFWNQIDLDHRGRSRHVPAPDEGGYTE